MNSPWGLCKTYIHQIGSIWLSWMMILEILIKFWNFGKILNVMQKIIFTLLHKYVISDQIYTIYLVQTKRMAQKWHLWHQLLKSTSKNWEPSYDWMTWCRKQFEDINYICRKQFEDINYIGMEDLKLWQILAELILWAYKLKALKSFS